jgi:hypothetical protein
MLQHPEPRRPFAFLKDLAAGGCKWPMRETDDGRHLLCNHADMPEHGAGRRAYRAFRAGLSRMRRSRRRRRASRAERGLKSPRINFWGLRKKSHRIFKSRESCPIPRSALTPRAADQRSTSSFLLIAALLS